MDKCGSQQKIEDAKDFLNKTSGSLPTACRDTGEMRLGRLEFAAMNNPLRRWLQKHIEFRIFKKQLKKRDISVARRLTLVTCEYMR